MLVHLDDLMSSISLGPTSSPVPSPAHPAQRKPMPARGEHLGPEWRRGHLEDRAEGLEDLIPIELELHQLPPVDDPDPRREERGDALPIAGFPRVADPVAARVAAFSKRTVVAGAVGCSSAMLRQARRSGRAPRRRGRRRTARARQKTIDSEDPERRELPLEGAAAGAVGAEVRPADEQRVGAQAEDVVVADGDVVGDLEQGRGSVCSTASAPRADQVPKIRWSTTSMAGANAVA